MTKKQLYNCGIELYEKIFNIGASSLLDDLHAAFSEKMYDIPHWYSYIERNITKYHKAEKKMIVNYAKYLCDAALLEFNGESEGFEAKNFIITLLAHARIFYFVEDDEDPYLTQCNDLTCLEMYYLEGKDIDYIWKYLNNGSEEKTTANYDYERFIFRSIERGRYHIGVVAICFMYEAFYKKLSYRECSEISWSAYKNCHNFPI